MSIEKGQELQKLLRVRVVAEIADVHPATVYEAVKRGQLRALRVGPGGRCLRFVPSDVHAWLRAARAGDAQ